MGVSLPDGRELAYEQAADPDGLADPVAWSTGQAEGHVLAPARYEEILASLSAVARSSS